MPLNTTKLVTIAKDPRAQAGVIAALVAVAVGSVARVDSADPQREDKLASIGEALARGSAETKPQTARNLDTRAMHEVSLAIRAACPDCVDLGGQLVQPGTETTAGGNLPRGSRLVAWADGCAKLGGTYAADARACVLGPAAVSWVVLGSSCEEREGDDESTWCEVRLRNGATDAQRVVVWVRAEVTP
jgi:hypothetical protein